MVNDRNGYSERIQRVVDYVAVHLDETLDLEKLSGVACFSPYHFHRIYRGLLGETVNDTVRRLRLHRAAVDLLDRELSIERAARRAGFGSQLRSRVRFAPNMASLQLATAREPTARPPLIESSSSICRGFASR
jgi:AraC-like DNA-binding protein